jgi:hypothetical protein
MASQGGAVSPLASGGDAFTVSGERAGLVSDVSGSENRRRLLGAAWGASPRTQLVFSGVTKPDPAAAGFFLSA